MAGESGAEIDGVMADVTMLDGSITAIVALEIKSGLTFEAAASAAQIFTASQVDSGMSAQTSLNAVLEFIASAESSMTADALADAIQSFLIEGSCYLAIGADANLFSQLTHAAGDIAEIVMFMQPELRYVAVSGDPAAGRIVFMQPDNQSLLSQHEDRVVKITEQSRIVLVEVN